MNRVDFALVRVLQFCVFALFTFMVLVYFGTLLLLPLSLLVQLIRIFDFVGMPGVVSTLIALPVVAYVGYLISKIPGLSRMMADIGVELVTFGQTRVKGFDSILSTLEGAESQSAAGG
jgi:hypothetical protein